MARKFENRAKSAVNWPCLYGILGTRTDIKTASDVPVHSGMTDLTDSKAFAPSSETKREFRDALGAFATGVTVVTTQSDLGPLGMTANSFTSLSLDPPLVLWAPASSSRRYDAFVHAEHFAIHVLAENQRDLGSHFSRQGHEFDLFGLQLNAHGVPILSGCLAVFECQHEAAYPGGDHAIIIGRVLAARVRSGAPLIFNGGNFGRLVQD